MGARTWSQEEDRQLLELRANHNRFDVIAAYLGRTTPATRMRHSLLTSDPGAFRRATNDNLRRSSDELLAAMNDAFAAHAATHRITPVEAQDRLMGGRAIERIPGTETYFGTASAMRRLVA